jgi:hypothetical protein
VHEIRNEIDIDAPIEVVWEILSDLPAYPDWNPFVRELVGALALGERLRARFELPEGREIRATVRVSALEPGRRLAWAGRAGLPGLCDGEHGFTLHPLPDGGVHVEDVERFTGLLVPLVRGLLDKAKPGFVAADLALKERAEKRAQGAADA